MEPESFLDKLGRLTADEAEIAAAETRREQEEFVTGEVARLDRARKEKEEADVARSRRRETLGMAWAAAELLKNANVPLESWINERPQYETKKGLFRTKEVFVQRLGSVAFEGWRLHDVNSDRTTNRGLSRQTAVTDDGSLSTSPPSINEKIEALALTSDGNVGFVRETTSLAGAAKREVEKLGGWNRFVWTDDLRDLIKDQRYGVFEHELVSLNPDGDTTKDRDFADFYADLSTRKRRLEAQTAAFGESFSASGAKKSETRDFMKALAESYKIRTRSKDVDVDASIQQSIARLLAANEISLK